MLKIVIAPNSFKGSLTAEEVCRAIDEGLRQRNLTYESILFPIADGGDHTAILLTKHLRGEIRSIVVPGAYGDDVVASYGLVDGGKTAIIEIAETSGFKSVKRSVLNPLEATTYGLGVLMKEVISSGAKAIYLCLGGSATVDGGIGMLAAMGVRFLNKEGYDVNVTPANFSSVEMIDVQPMKDLLQGVQISILADVSNPLLGPNGAATVFGPQKGASEQDVIFLEKFLSRFSQLTSDCLRLDMTTLQSGGAAGGVAATAAVYLSASLVDGATFFCEKTGFMEVIKGADLLITAEGSIDDQTLQGKAPYRVAIIARTLGIPVIGLAGKIPLQISAPLQELFNSLWCINNEPTSLTEAIPLTYKNLVRTSKQLGQLLQLRKEK